LKLELAAYQVKFLSVDYRQLSAVQQVRRQLVQHIKRKPLRRRIEIQQRDFRPRLDPLVNLGGGFLDCRVQRHPLRPRRLMLRLGRAPANRHNKKYHT
jgi:hypothetical protein